MTTNSPNIDRAIQMAIGDGNSIKEVSDGWSKVKQVVHMNGKLSPFVRSEIQLQVPSLRYWVADRTPHNAAEEGYICDDHLVGLTFPR